MVFCTYQSLDRLSLAQQMGAPESDLIICDEAHRTTGLDREARGGENDRNDWGEAQSCDSGCKRKPRWLSTSDGVRYRRVFSYSPENQQKQHILYLPTSSCQFRK